MAKDKQADAKSKVIEIVKRFKLVEGKKIDAEIDELVYKIYSITEKEKKIIEESLK